MDIRTKLVFALVAASLGSMLALGAFSHDATKGLLHRMALRELEAVAQIKKQDLERVIVAWRDRVLLVASRTQLRKDVGELRLDGRGDEAVIGRIQRILDDALASTRALRGISVYTSAGFFVTSAGIDLGDHVRVRPVVFMNVDDPVVFDYVTFDPEHGLLVSFVAPMRIEGILKGAVKVRLSAQELIDVTEDYTGLGATGETVLAQLTPEGDALVLTPLRHDADAGVGQTVARDRVDDPTLQAARGIEALHSGGAFDYRGQEVWAATRYLDEFGWGVVVKLDAEEELAPIVELRETMIRLGLSLSAFAILGGTLLGFYISRPIRSLADLVRRFGEGEHDVRAPVSGDDEVAVLARSFNEMADGLGGPVPEDDARELGTAASPGSRGLRDASGEAPSR